VFLVTRRAGSILHDVCFVEAVLFMTALAFAIDRFDADAVAKTIAQYFAEFSFPS